MYIPKKLSFSMFLMLMLIQTAISVPVETNAESKDVQPKPDANPVASDKKLNDIVDKLYQDELDPSGYETFAQINPLENYKNFTESLQDSIKEKLADAKDKVDGLLTQLSPVENAKKLKNLLEKGVDKLSNIKPLETLKNSTVQVANLYKQHLSNVNDKIDDFISQLNAEDNEN